MGGRYDIVGDIHGMIRTLEALVAGLGYARSGGRWRHPEGRQLVFTGDILDRGPDPLGCLEMCAGMVEDGAAKLVLGNHELNALHFTTRHRSTGDPLRPHDEKNRRQFAHTLRQIEERPSRWEALRDFLVTVPTRLSLAEDQLRVIHACWNHEDISSDSLPPVLDDPDALERSADRTQADPLWQTFECCLKGPEVPTDRVWTDKDGIPRKTRRVRWWEEYSHEAPFIAFGHYWFELQPGESVQDLSLLGPGRNAICLDFSLGKGGRVGVIRWPEMDLLEFENRDPLPSKARP